MKINKLLIIAAFLLIVPTVNAQFVKVLGVAEKSGKVISSGVTSTNSASLTFPAATITIYSPSGSGLLANIYSDSAGTPKANSYSADSSGVYDFFIQPGVTFDVRIAPIGGTPAAFTRSGYTASGGISGATVMVCGGSNDTTILDAADVVGATIIIPHGVTCASNSQTISAALQIDSGGLLKPLTGQTVTLTGPQLAGAWQTFTNATSGLGSISFSGNTALTYIDPAWWGVLGVAHGSAPTDESTGMLATLAAWYTAKGGVIQFGARKYRFDSSLLIPNDGASPTPSQPSLRITGVGASPSGQGGAPVGGTIIDLRYNSILSKIDTRGLGLLELDRITFVDGGASSSVPFIQTTNTTLHIHNNEFYGNTASTPTQDAIVLGNVSTVLSGDFNAPFQGYGTVIERNYFNRIQRGVYARTYANAILIQNNQWWTSCGATTSAAAVEFIGVGGNNSGNVITGNLIEMDHYAYGMKFGDGFVNNNVGPNGFFDAGGGVTAFYRFESGAQLNLVIDGYRDDAFGTLISEAGTAIGTNFVLTSHQGETSIFPQPVRFTNGDVSIVGNGLGLITENAAGDQWVQDIAAAAATGKPFSFRFRPSGGSLESGVQFIRASATDKQIFLGGSTNNLIFGASDLRVAGATGANLFLGVINNQSVQVLNTSGTTTAFPFTSTLATGTAPFPVTSTTVNPNFNADKLDGQDWVSPIFTTSAISPLFRSTAAKVLLQGTGTGATQLATTQTTPPTCTTNCGTSPTVTGTDTFMSILLGTTPASGFVVNFNGTWAAAPPCTAQMGKAGMVVGKLALTAVTTTTTITVVTNGTAPDTGDIYFIHCGGVQ